MSTGTAALGGRLDLSARTLGVALGDGALVTLLITLGEIRHYSVGWVLANPLGVVETALPFYVGWLLASLAVGAYAADALATPRRAALLAGGSWVVAATVGALLRGTSLFSGGFALTFLAVMMGFGLLALVPWRVAASLALEPAA